MRENWMWHFPTHEIWVKANEEWKIVEVRTTDYNSPEYIVIKISSSILQAINNNSVELLERINKIYWLKVKSIIEWEKELLQETKNVIEFKNKWNKWDQLNTEDIIFQEELFW